MPGPAIPLMGRLQRHFITGLVALLPLGITLFVFWFIITQLGNLCAGLLRYLPGVTHLPEWTLTILGFLLLLVVVLGVGALTSSLLGRWMMEKVERFFRHLPLVRGIYSSARQLTDAIFVDRRALKRVVVVEYPRKGIYSLGFVTFEEEIGCGPGRKGLFVFLPSTPNPTTGWLILFPVEEIYETGLSVEEGMKLIVSGGIVSPHGLRELITTTGSEGLAGRKNFYEP